MRLAVFADIHGNIHALRACVRAALEDGAEGFILLGDFVTDLASPREVMDAIYELREKYPCWLVRGNREGYLLSHRAGEENYRPGSKTGSLYYTYHRLTQKDLDFFDSLPIYDRAVIGGVPLEMAHAERCTDRHTIEPWDPYLDTVFAQMQTDILLTGHCHTQYIRQQCGKTILNPGSLGLPKETPGMAEYAMVSLSPAGCSFRLCTAPFDVEQAVIDQFDSGLWEAAPWWTVGICNNLISAGESALRLVNRVHESRDPWDEANWEKAARELGLVLTREEMLHRWKTSVFYRCTLTENGVE